MENSGLDLHCKRLKRIFVRNQKVFLFNQATAAQLWLLGEPGLESLLVHLLCYLPEPRKLHLQSKPTGATGETARLAEAWTFLTEVPGPTSSTLGTTASR